MTAKSLGFCLCLLTLLSGLPAQPQFPLLLSGDGRHLDGADRKPFLVVGDTAWSLIAQLKEEDIRRYLDDRRQRGFNSIILNLIEHKFASKVPANIYGVAPFLKPGDLSRPNPAYFDCAHRAVEAANQRGIMRIEGELANAAGQTLRTPGDNGTGAGDWPLVLRPS